MKIFDDIKLEIEEKRVLHLLGYKDRIPDDDILDCIRTEISKCSTYLNPAVYYKYININCVADDYVLLENNVKFEGEFISAKLKDCNKIIVVITTLGQKVNQVIEEAFSDGDYLKAIIIDNISTEAIGYVNKLFWNEIVNNIKNSNIGLTQTLSPGDTQWELQEQGKIFACMGDDFKEVKLTESFLMLPSKSTAAVYGFGENIGIAKKEHICSECTMKHCTFRSDEKIPLIVNLNGSKEVIDVKKGENLLRVLQENKIFINSPCNGKGTCGKCKVRVIKGIKKESNLDENHLHKEEIQIGYRLSCGINVDEKMEIIINAADNDMEVMTDGIAEIEDISPIIRKIYCQISPASLEDQRDDFLRLKDSINIKHLSIDLLQLRNLNKKLREFNFNITAVLNDNKLLSIEKNDTVKQFYGIAVDIGTTTIAVYLMNLTDGKTIDVISEINNQKNYGADVVSRIFYTAENKEGSKILKDVIISQLNSMIENICNKNNIETEKVYDVCIVGNTTMIHLLLGLPCENIAMAPYIPVTNSSMEFESREVGLITNGIISIVPGISAYVGSDITAGILTCGMLETEKYSLLLDIGTNGEMALGNKMEVITCSTAAGPAFEGANIKHGVGGISGAICKIDLSKDKIYETIGNKKPIGICGSGVLDMVAQMLKYDLMDETGRITDLDDEELSDNIIEINGIKQFVVAQLDDNEQITFSQKDVREVQLAKSAISAGIKILLKEKNLTYDDIDTLYLAGGFGNYMDKESAAAIGLIPKELKHKIKNIGNSAGSGAKAYLMSKKLREKAEELKSRTDYLELSSNHDFQDFFIEGMMFE